MNAKVEPMPEFLPKALVVMAAKTGIAGRPVCSASKPR